MTHLNDDKTAEGVDTSCSKKGVNRFLEELLSLNSIVDEIWIGKVAVEIKLAVPVSDYNTIRIRKNEDVFEIELPVRDEYSGYELDDPRSLIVLSEKELAEFSNAKEFVEFMISLAKLYKSLE